ncbi:polysaccharide deacetylase family protein [Geopsychrobacter electrodiphilus]|uniref:polysaccharide deacetylase family protein n=1 Tax=Geopsychrobacter electrodiphilus TaxID=225196 RepID=UPI00038015E8|nr:polysaccharide deacetylase family protein [Geopsychrobacter electrodiphilus]
MINTLLKIFAPLLCCLLLGFSAPVKADSSALLITHGPRNRPRIALTFDLCQTPKHPSGFDRGVIKVLQQTATPATFFVGGDWLRTHSQEAAELKNPLFVLGNHSWDHPDLRKLDDAAIRTEIERTESLLQQHFGPSPQLFRLPFGYFDARVLQAISTTGVRTIQWDVVSGDPDRNFSAAQLVKTVTKAARNGSIVVMHANGRGWQTAKALPEIIRTLRSRGFKLVSVTTLLN